MAGRRIKEMSQDEASKRHFLYKRPTLIWVLFRGMSTEVGVKRIVLTTLVVARRFIN
jgi:hypothetical protein